MSKYRELVFLVTDLVKTFSDDSIINENHIMFLLGKYRTYLLKQKYEDEVQDEIPSSNYQTICADLIEVPLTPAISDCDDSCVCSLNERTLLRTKRKLPELSSIGNVRITGNNSFKEVATLVSPERFDYVGYNSWHQNVIYATNASDGYMYFTSNNPSFLKLKKVHISGIFEDPLKASEQTYCEGESSSESGGCPYGDNLSCDEMDREFPMEDALLTQLMALVIKDVLGAAWRPKDNRNNANDDISDLANFIRNYMKKDYRDIVE